MAGSRQNEGEEIVVALWLMQGRTSRSSRPGYEAAKSILTRKFLGRTSRPGATAIISSQGMHLTMSAFDQLDWTRFDVWATVAMEGVAVVETARRDACHTWLRQHGYALTSIDFAQGVGPAAVALGEQFRWEDRFGNKLTPEKRNLLVFRVITQLLQAFFPEAGLPLFALVALSI